MDPGSVWRWAYAADGTTDDLHRARKDIGAAADDMSPSLRGLRAHGAVRHFEETWTKVAQHLIDAAHGTADKLTVSADVVSQADHQSVEYIDQAGHRLVAVDLDDDGNSWVEGSR